MNNKPDVKTDLSDILDAINGCYGVVDVVAKSLGVSWETATECINHNRITKRAFKNEIEKARDLAYSRLLTAIKKGDAWAIQFYFLNMMKKSPSRITQVFQSLVTKINNWFLGVGK